MCNSKPSGKSLQTFKSQMLSCLGKCHMTSMHLPRTCLHEASFWISKLKNISEKESFGEKLVICKWIFLFQLTQFNKFWSRIFKSDLFFLEPESSDWTYKYPPHNILLMLFEYRFMNKPLLILLFCKNICKFKRFLSLVNG